MTKVAKAKLSDQKHAFMVTSCILVVIIQDGQGWRPVK